MGRYYKNKQSGFFETVLTAIGKGLWWLVSWPFKKIFNISGAKKFDKVENLKKWRQIEVLLDSGDEIHAEQAIIRADKFFDNILKQAGAKGESFSKRLISFEDKFPTDVYQLVWQAHKVRNVVSHETDYRLEISQARNALGKFRRGLTSLGAL